MFISYIFWSAKVQLFYFIQKFSDEKLKENGNHFNRRVLKTLFNHKEHKERTKDTKVKYYISVHCVINVIPLWSLWNFFVTLVVNGFLFLIHNIPLIFCLFHYICVQELLNTSTAILWKTSLFQQGNTGLPVLIW